MTPPPDRPDDDEPASRTPALVGLVLIVVLVVVGVVVATSLRNTGKLQDCVMSGRTNCAPIAGDSPGR